MPPCFCLLPLLKVHLHLTLAVHSPVCRPALGSLPHAETLRTALAQVLSSLAFQLLNLIGKCLELNNTITEPHTSSLIIAKELFVFSLCNLKLPSTEATGTCFFFFRSPAFPRSHRYCKMAAVWRELFYIFDYAALFIISFLPVLSL